MLTPGEAHDSTAYLDLMAEHDVDPEVLLADRGYDSDPIRDDVRERGGGPEIPTQKNRCVQHSVNGALYAPRARIEPFFDKPKNSRRAATRYDHTASSFLGFVQLAAIRQSIRFCLPPTSLRTSSATASVRRPTESEASPSRPPAARGMARKRGQLPPVGNVGLCLLEDTTVPRLVLAASLLIGIAGCSALGFRPSHGTGAADLGATEGFGLGASNEGSPVNQANPGPTVFEPGGG